MSQTSCPICFTLLEARQVSPCFICGPWEDSLARMPQTTFKEYRLPSGQTITLCPGCELEEFMVTGGSGFVLVPGKKRPIELLQYVQTIDNPTIQKDKYCPSCNRRLAFLKLLANQ